MEKPIDKGQKVVCAFLDLRKVFDAIDHQIYSSENWKKMEYMVKSRTGLRVISHKDTSLSLVVLHNHSDERSAMECLKVLFLDQHCSTYTSMEYQKHVQIAMLYIRRRHWNICKLEECQHSRAKSQRFANFRLCIVWGDCGKRNAQRLERLQNQAMRIILGANRKTCTQEMRTKLVLLSLKNRRRLLRL